MGQKIHPKGFRLGIVFPWTSRWFARKGVYQRLLLQDVRLRRALFARLRSAGLAQIDIERSINKVTIVLHVSRPGVVIGRGGSGLEETKKFIEKIVKDTAPAKSPSKTKLELTVEPVKEANLNAHLVATTLADQLGKRLPHKRICNQAVERVMNAGAKGVRVILAGRIAGAEIARREKYQAGSVPLSTLREIVDFAAVPALTKSGYVGIKVWICRKG